MAIYHYAIMDFAWGFIKTGQINATSIQDAQDHLMGDDLSVMVSENKIPYYKNKNNLSTNDS